MNLNFNNDQPVINWSEEDTYDQEDRDILLPYLSVQTLAADKYTDVPYFVIRDYDIPVTQAASLKLVIADIQKFYAIRPAAIYCNLLTDNVKKIIKLSRVSIHVPKDSSEDFLRTEAILRRIENTVTRYLYTEEPTRWAATNYHNLIFNCLGN